MADKPEPPDDAEGNRVVSETTTWHLADGTPTSNSDEAESGEVTTTYADGRVQHRLLRKVN